MPMSRARYWLIRLLLAVAVAVGVLLMSRFEVARPLDNWLYDRMVAGLQQPVDDRIVLVVADDKS
ncbi:MAG: hypothetical protein QM612_03600, partial [Thermomonas sp.]|uniref:hypothetical protein n=1 Tax=Thermomonas sp. TaxID=1971895 RepID=UPI0039E61968